MVKSAVVAISLAEVLHILQVDIHPLLQEAVEVDLLVRLQACDVAGQLFVVTAETELLLFHSVDELDDLTEDGILDQRLLEAVVLMQLLHLCKGF